MIDYEKLARALHASHGPNSQWESLSRNQKGWMETDCKSIVAALRKQGLVVVRFLFAGGMSLIIPVDVLSGIAPFLGEFIRSLGVCEGLGAAGST